MIGNAIRVTENHTLQVDKLITNRSKPIDQNVELNVSVCIGEKTVIFPCHPVTVAS
jgi:hypothetical protein